MMEDLEAIRRAQLERHNGRFRTWWHYNRWTLLVMLWAVALLVALVHAAKAETVRAQADARLVYAAAEPMLDCWTQARATSFVAVGGSQQQVYDGIYAAEQQLGALRQAYMIVRTAKGSEEFRKANAGKEMP